MGPFTQAKIFVAGHRGMVGGALVRALLSQGVPANSMLTRSRQELDLTQQQAVRDFFDQEKPDQVYLAAAKVGGIHANNSFPADFIYENLMVQSNVIEAAFRSGVKKLLFLGSSCIYPKYSKQPIKEHYLLSGILEPTNESYAIAKIAGVKLCESYNRQYKLNYKCLMPSNIFGPNDNYNLESSHFFPAIIKKLHNAKVKNLKKTTFWGTGSSKRELTFVDDIAEACIFFLKKKTKHTLINIGSGYEKSIKGYVNFFSKQIKNKSKIVFDNNRKLDGTPRKLLDCGIAKKYGWKPKFKFSTAFKLTYNDFIKNNSKYY
jgi:GDP-L-fucose synthase